MRDIAHGDGIRFWDEGDPGGRTEYAGQFVNGQVGYACYAHARTHARTHTRNTSLIAAIAVAIAIKITITKLAPSLLSLFQRSGVGIMRLTDGTCYEGQWKAGRPEGHGKETYPDESSYTGQFHGDKRHGLGIYVFPDDSVYAGNWCDGLQDGLGLKILKQDKTLCIFEKCVASASAPLPPCALVRACLHFLGLCCSTAID